MMSENIKSLYTFYILRNGIYLSCIKMLIGIHSHLKINTLTVYSENFNPLIVALGSKLGRYLCVSYKNCVCFLPLGVIQLNLV